MMTSNMYTVCMYVSLQGRNKAKAKPTNINLKKAPYQIEDGDLIGYIIAADEHSVSVENFHTDLEENLKQMLADKKREQYVKNYNLNKQS